MTVLMGIILLVFTPLGKIERFSQAYFPIQATEWLKTNPLPGNMFNTFDWGGYISLELFPKQLVYIDSQGDVYGETFIREYEQIVNLDDGWQDILSKYKVNWMLIPKTWEMVPALSAAGWQDVYHDDTAVILLHGE